MKKTKQTKNTKKEPKNHIHKFTKYVDQDLKEKWTQKIAKILQYFPELQNDKFKIGKTETAAGVYCQTTKNKPYEYIRLSKNVNNITIAHEFTHILQQRKNIPKGEKQCDIWTLARTHKYLDQPPNYLKIPNTIKKEWNKNKKDIHQLAKKSINKRKKGTRNYIKWLEKNLKKL